MALSGANIVAIVLGRLFLSSEAYGLLCVCGASFWLGWMVADWSSDSGPEYHEMARRRPLIDERDAEGL